MGGAIVGRAGVAGKKLFFRNPALAERDILQLHAVDVLHPPNFPPYQRGNFVRRDWFPVLEKARQRRNRAGLA